MCLHRIQCLNRCVGNYKERGTLQQRNSLIFEYTFTCKLHDTNTTASKLNYLTVILVSTIQPNNLDFDTKISVAMFFHATHRDQRTDWLGWANGYWFLLEYWVSSVCGQVTSTLGSQTFCTWVLVQIHAISDSSRTGFCRRWWQKSADTVAPMLCATRACVCVYEKSCRSVLITCKCTQAPGNSWRLHNELRKLRRDVTDRACAVASLSTRE